MRIFRLSLLGLLRDWRAGELRVLALALAIAVASTTAVGFFTDRVGLLMERQASALLGADLSVVSSDPVNPGLAARARDLGLETADTVGFPSVVLASGKTELLGVKSVSSGYPLRGVLRVAQVPYGKESPTHAIPAPGTVWLGPRALTRLGLRVGDRIRLGSSELTIARVLGYEPDRGGDLFSIAPRLLMNLQDMPATGLIGPGSRVTYRLLIAGPAPALAKFRQWVSRRIEPGERLEDVRDARPQLREALHRARKFLGLAALVSVLLAGVAIATATRRYAARHLDGTAVMRCLGATQRYIVWLHVLQMTWLGLGASLAGCAAGYFAQQVLVHLLSGFVAAPLPPPSAFPVVTGLLTGLVTLLGFALPPVLRLKDVAPARVLRRDLGQLPAKTWLVYAAALTVVAGLMLWQTRDLRLTAYLLLATSATLGVLGAVAYALVRLLRLVRTHSGVAWRLGLSGLVRRAGTSVVQVVSFGIGIMLLLLLSLVRSDLLNEWVHNLPPDAPNQFVINVQPDQVVPLRRFFADNGLKDAVLYPMVRGRLLAINRRPVGASSYSDIRARHLVEREFNLSWAAQLQRDNRIVAGQWWSAAQYGKPLVSVEQGLASTLGIKLGDTLEYRIADRDLEVRVVNIRQVEWDSFRVNFFVVTPPGLLDGYPATYITSFHLAADRHGLLQELMQHFPNLTIIDVQAVMAQVRSIMHRVNLSLEYVFLFTVLAGLTVLYAAVQATQDERAHEAALMRVMGATTSQLTVSLAVEFVAIGLVAGFLAALGAAASGYLIALQLFHLHYHVDPRLWLAGMASGGIGVGLFGVWGTRHVLARPPLQVLRDIS
ncbi:MAG: ABC transporter permease [Acidiferrobacterales bacterium]